jgi:2-desacetyl-2-hydroxyethyl bacteriochlorophyllide A dehydrogenase
MSRRTLYFAAEREATIRERHVPGPGPEEVRMETTASAISAGTELLIYRGEAPEAMVADEALAALDGDLSLPLAYGYAAVGDVVECGQAVSDEWLGRAVFAFNPHETEFLADPDDLVEVPGGMAPSTAALLPHAETAVNFALDGHPRIGERVAVFGAGLVGLCTTSVLAEFPLAELVVVDPVDARRQLAATLGADRAVSPAEASGLSDQASQGIDLVYELSGNPDALDDAIDAVGYDGRVIVGSWYGTKRADLDLGGRFHRDRVTIESSQVSTIAPDLRGRWTTDRRLATALDHLGDIDADALVHDHVPFESAPAAYRRLDAEHPPGGIILTYDP